MVPMGGYNEVGAQQEIGLLATKNAHKFKTCLVTKIYSLSDNIKKILTTAVCRLETAEDNASSFACLATLPLCSGGWGPSCGC